jgi:hypothetical protein
MVKACSVSVFETRFPVVFVFERVDSRDCAWTIVDMKVGMFSGIEMSRILRIRKDMDLPSPSSLYRH